MHALHVCLICMPYMPVMSKAFAHIVFKHLHIDPQNLNPEPQTMVQEMRVLMKTLVQYQDYYALDVAHADTCAAGTLIKATSSQVLSYLTSKP